MQNSAGWRISHDTGPRPTTRGLVLLYAACGVRLRCGTSPNTELTSNQYQIRIVKHIRTWLTTNKKEQNEFLA
jgi:hypothetical protein